MQSVDSTGHVYCLHGYRYVYEQPQFASNNAELIRNAVGDQFGEQSDQEALMDILRKTEADHARPTASIQQQLMKAWGWLPENDE